MAFIIKLESNLRAEDTFMFYSTSRSNEKALKQLLGHMAHNGFVASAMNSLNPDVTIKYGDEEYNCKFIPITGPRFV